jgi:hypothetical protein
MHQNAISEVLSQDTSRDGVTLPFSPGIGITNTPLFDQVLGHSLHSRTFFKRKNITAYTGIPHLALLIGSRKTALTELRRKVNVQKLK